MALTRGTSSFLRFLILIGLIFTIANYTVYLQLRQRRGDGTQGARSGDSTGNQVVRGKRSTHVEGSPVLVMNDTVREVPPDALEPDGEPESDPTSDDSSKAPEEKQNLHQGRVEREQEDRKVEKEPDAAEKRPSSKPPHQHPSTKHQHTSHQTKHPHAAPNEEPSDLGKKGHHHGHQTTDHPTKKPHHKGHTRHPHQASDAPQEEEQKPHVDSADEPTAAPKHKKLSRKDKRKLFDIQSKGEGGEYVFHPQDFPTTLLNYVDYVKKPLEELLEQSSNRFKDIHEAANFGVRLPSTKGQLAALQLWEAAGFTQETKEGREYKAKLTGNPETDGEGSSAGSDDGDSQESSSCGTPHLALACDASDPDYTEERDRQCLAYLGNICNWLSVKPMSSILSTGRTIKFKVFYKELNLSAVMKVSQKKFALEPASEVMAFYTDRELRLYRVPPTVWVAFPITFLQAAAATSTVPQFYSHWFKKFSLEYESTQPLQKIDLQMFSLNCMNVSLQLWMNDIHDTDETVLTPPDDFKRYLKLEPTEDGEGKGAHSDVDWSKQTAIMNISVTELVKEFIFDFLIDNTDRWFGHNSFAVGGCLDGESDPKRKHFYGDAKARCHPPKEQWRRTKSDPKYAFIDQGSSFYRGSNPESNPYSDDKGSADLCRFPSDLGRRLLEVNHQLSRSVRTALPKGVMNLGSNRLLKSMDKRLETLVTLIRSCVNRFGEQEVLFFR